MVRPARQPSSLPGPGACFKLPNSLSITTSFKHSLKNWNKTLSFSLSAL
ncbi:hypothetical protein HanLR1_Chr10g0356391 [Helianthus annuus]|nr:hypothetical protein HanLR1_Chr10g0356391 [Helianthus annuus]